MSANHNATDGRPPTTRSRLTNNRTVVADADGRSAWARRLRDLVSAHTSDLGGADNVSTAEASLIRRAAVLTVEMEKLESKFASDKGTPSDLDLYQRSAGNLRRLVETLGLQRRAKPVPSLQEYLSSLQQPASPEDSNK